MQLTTSSTTFGELSLREPYAGSSDFRSVPQLFHCFAGDFTEGLLNVGSVKRGDLKQHGKPRRLKDKHNIEENRSGYLVEVHATQFAPFFRISVWYLAHSELVSLVPEQHKRELRDVSDAKRKVT